MSGHNQENLYKEIVTAMLEGVMVISMNGKITMLNPSAEKMLGLTQNDIGSLYINVFLNREDNDAFNELILDTIYEKKKVSTMPVDYVLHGRTKNLSVTTSYIHNKQEKSVVVVIDDITNLKKLYDAKLALKKIKKLNAEYEKAKNEAITANETKSRFLSHISHEIRTPINAVLGMNEMILRECTDSRLLSYASNIQSSGKTLLFLINDLLDMSRIESGKMEIIPVNYELSSLMTDLWNGIYLRAQEKGLRLSFSIEETTPKTLSGDDVRIKQVISNLLTNAVKYTAKGSVEMNISYKDLAEHRISLIISVKDTGIGIKKEDMGKLFESFQRIEEEKNRSVEGSGLGMSIAMSLLHLMGGSLDVKSSYGKGSVFTVTIPQTAVSKEPAGSFESMRQQQKEHGKNHGLFEAPGGKILAVDDNAMNLMVFTSLLKRTKVNITTAKSGKECMDLIKKETFHIIFMDHMMPEMDGIETCHAIKTDPDSKNKKTPVIALTANAVSGAKEFYLKEGFTDFLTKPIDTALLEQSIVSYLPETLVHKPAQEREQAAEGFPESYEGYGISPARGLSNCRNDRELYLDLVRLFLKEKEKAGQMRQFLLENNPSDYAILAHGLKGNAKTLGADPLADIAYSHEMQGKAGNTDYLLSHWEELEKTWDNAIEGFSLLYEKHKTRQQKENHSPEPLLLKQNELEEIAALIDNFETKTAAGRLRSLLDRPLAQDIRICVQNALTALEDEFDEDKAIQILTTERN